MPWTGDECTVPELERYNSVCTSDSLTFCTASRCLYALQNVAYLCASPRVIRVTKSRMRWAKHAACMGHEKYAKILFGNPKGERLLALCRHKLEDDIKMEEMAS